MTITLKRNLPDFLFENARNYQLTLAQCVEIPSDPLHKIEIFEEDGIFIQKRQYNAERINRHEKTWALQALRLGFEEKRPEIQSVPNTSRNKGCP